VDQPNSRKIHARPIPLLGGVGVYIGVVATLWLCLPRDHSLKLMMLGSLFMMLLGVADDRFDLHSRYRLMLQIAVAAGLSFSGVRFHFFPLGALNHLVTIVWIVGVINAMNCLDCADGTAGGACVVTFLAFAALAAANGRWSVCQASLAAAGAVGGFLVYNAPPARVFLGDAGSTFLGLMAAVLAILANPHPHGHWQMPAAPFVLTVPVFDIIWVHLVRYRAGIHSVRDLLASTGKDHLPHRLMAHGYTRMGCMGMMIYLSALAAAGVYGLTQGVWAGAVLTIAAVIAFLWHLEHRGEVAIREQDQVAIYHARLEPRPLQLSQIRGESTL
jgi:UDP-GlcNAc:undecaprenyl-phosphate/decaprenyl-phosphate GlcNAc-1-phosphate transferase